MQVASTPRPANRSSPALTTLVPDPPPGFSSISADLFSQARRSDVLPSPPLSLRATFRACSGPWWPHLGDRRNAHAATNGSPERASTSPCPATHPRHVDLHGGDSRVHKPLSRSHTSALTPLSSLSSPSTRLIVPVHSLSVLYTTILHANPLVSPNTTTTPTANMKYAFVAIALAAAVHAQTIDDVPECAIPCLDDAIASETDCATDDYPCVCENFDAIQGVATSCVISECGAETALSMLTPSF